MEVTGLLPGTRYGVSFELWDVRVIDTHETPARVPIANADSPLVVELWETNILLADRA